MDEADVFYADPAKFLDTYFRESGKEDVQVPGQEYSIKTFRWASHILIFEALEEDVRDRLLTRGYRLVCFAQLTSDSLQCKRFFNTHWHDDDRRRGDILIYCST